MTHQTEENTAAEAVPDVVHLAVPTGTRILVTSDLHLRDQPTDASEWAVEELAKVLDVWQGPGVLVFAGDLIELWAGDIPDAARALEAHPEFVRSVSSFAVEEGRTVLYLVGNHDGRAGWEQATIDVTTRRLGCRLGFAAEIEVEGVPGSTVRMEHGHAYDPTNAFEDPRDPYASPLGQHIVQEFLPSFHHVKGDWLDGVETLADPRTFPAFISSRLFYRKVAKQSLWLLIPILLALVVRIPIAYAWLDRELDHLRPFSRVLFEADLVLVANLVLGGLILFLLMRSWWKTASTIVAEKRGGEQNDNTKAAAARFIEDGFAGLVCGHTHHAELSAVGAGFYANTGSGTKVLDRVESAFGLPAVFLPRIQLSWVDLEAGTSPPWSVTLTRGRRALHGASRLEQMVARKGADIPPDPSLTDDYP